MNKYEEALNGITDYIVEKLRQDDLSINHFMLDIDNIEELVKRATPKKPIGVEYEIGLCPVCNERCCVYENYCDECGQALDWSEDE